MYRVISSTLAKPGVPAFSTIQGGNTSNNTTAGGTKNNELINARWYAVYDGSSSTGRAVAQYQSAGSPFWATVKTCAAC